MREPAQIQCCKQYFERQFIEIWIKNQSPTCPLCRAKITLNDLKTGEE